MLAKVVLDTNVLYAGLRSNRGASFQILSRLGMGDFNVYLSVPLVLEYESVLKRSATSLGLTLTDIDDVIDFVCAASHHRRIFFVWRPLLRDPNDDLVLEVAVEAGCEFVVTHNLLDFVGSERVGVRAITPRDFLAHVRQ